MPTPLPGSSSRERRQAETGPVLSVSRQRICFVIPTSAMCSASIYRPSCCSRPPYLHEQPRSFPSLCQRALSLASPLACFLAISMRTKRIDAVVRPRVLVARSDWSMTSRPATHELGFPSRYRITDSRLSHLNEMHSMHNEQRPAAVASVGESDGACFPSDIE